jgi:hypothetical protein
MATVAVEDGADFENARAVEQAVMCREIGAVAQPDRVGDGTCKPVIFETFAARDGFDVGIDFADQRPGEGCAARVIGRADGGFDA